jgi:hypothetical protein
MTSKNAQDDSTATKQPNKETDDQSKRPDKLDQLTKLAQTVAVVIGVVISVLSFNATREKEALARENEAKSRVEESKNRELEASRYVAQRKAEAAKPFIALQYQTYLDALKTAAQLANKSQLPEPEIAAARKRFRELYVAELSFVEDKKVEGAMKAFAEVTDTELLSFTEEQKAAYRLAHALRDSLQESWNFASDAVDSKPAAE